VGHLKNTRTINVPIYNVSMEDDILNLDTSISITLVFPNIRDSGCMYADKRWYVNDANGTASANPVTIISVSGIQINDAVSQQLSTDNFGTSIFATNENKYIITGTGSGSGGSTTVETPFVTSNTPIIVGDDFQIVAEKAQGQINDIVTNVTTLQNNEYKITYFAEISTATGTITKPTGSTIMLDQFAGGVDAYVSKIANGQPTGNFPTTAGGVAVDVSSFDAMGNFTLSGAPSSYPVALIYILKIKAKDYSNLDITKILDLEGVSVVNLIRQEFLYTSGAQTFTLSNSASAVYAVFVNGQELRQSQYTVVTTTLTIVDTLEANDRVDVIYSNATLGINPSYTKAETDTLFVPYTGATSNVDLGEFELKAGQIELDQSPTGTAGVAVTRWNNTIGSSETTLKGGNVILKNGVDLVARVVNKVTPNTTLTKAAYQAVRISGAQGQRLAVQLAQANNDNNSADTLGVVTETIATNQEGFILTVGQLEEINTTGSLQGETWADGDVLYLSPTVAGAITNVKPTGLTGHIVVLGYVEYSHAVHGKIYIKIMNGWELDELHNVYINPATLADNDVLQYDSASSLWENKPIVTPNNSASNLFSYYNFI
jgi:nitrogen fixation protein